MSQVCETLEMYMSNDPDDRPGMASLQGLIRYLVDEAARPEGAGPARGVGNHITGRGKMSGVKVRDC